METNFEQINAEIEKVDLTKFQEGGINHFSTETVTINPSEVIQKICSIYKSAKPILKGISLIPFIPIKWKAVISTMIKLMDNLCPTI